MFQTTSTILAFLLALSVLSASGVADAGVFVVGSGRFERQDTPVRIDLPAERLGDSVSKSLSDGPKAMILRELHDGNPIGGPISAQVESVPGTGDAMVRLTWIVPGKTAEGTVRRFRPEPNPLATASGHWSLSNSTPGALELKHGDRAVFRYNLAPVSSSNYGPIQARDAYLHPAFTPSGALITGDFSRAHPHHRGFFLAYAKTQVGRLHPDFWNIHTGSGKIHFDKLDQAIVGPVTTRINSRHRWEVKGGAVVLRERWEIEAYDIPGSPYWLFDLTSTQQAASEPFEVRPYRYGGMAYRGPEPFVKGTLDVLTSEGLDRRRGDQEPARWVDLTGPVADGSDRYGGALILDHPSNPHHPTVVRIHPTSLPFFCFTPAYDTRLTIATDAPTVFRYRVMIHDGRPDRARDERLWRDFAEPPKVVWEREKR